MIGEGKAEATGMKWVQKLFEAAHGVVVGLFLVSALALIVFAAGELWGVIRPSGEVTLQARFVSVLECIGLLTIAVASLELGQTILEEAVLRSAAISGPTRARRFLSRFIVVVVIALSIECLVAVFELIHESPEYLPHAASVGLAAAVLLASWGFFVRMNIVAEELESHRIHEVTQEDEKVEGEDAPPNATERPAADGKLPPRHATGRDPGRSTARSPVVRPGSQD
jgi:hypothetical protein